MQSPQKSSRQAVTFSKQPNQTGKEVAGYHSELRGLGFIVWDIAEVNSFGLE